MPTLNDVASAQAGLAEADVDWLRLLVGDWQLVSDLSFADLVLWVPRRPELGGGWVVGAHVRPTTGQMVFLHDLVGTVVTEGSHRLDWSHDTQARAHLGTDPWLTDGGRGVDVDAVPVVRGTRSIAVLTRHTSAAVLRAPSGLEVSYRATADALLTMIAEGEFPTLAAAHGRRGAPRVGDGVLLLSGDGEVTYASPNAVSAMHRLGWSGDLVGQRLLDVVTDLQGHGAPVDEALPIVVTGRAAWRSEIESRGVSVAVRAVPVIARGTRTGALLLMRDVTELRRSEGELLAKDATVREIHHRVKNNLQTVAALLRLQSRRLEDERARAALSEAGRRVATIALVHETLSQSFEETVDFDVVADRCVQAVLDIGTHQVPLAWHREGSFGLLRAEDATPLAMVITELVQNAVEHGLWVSGGRIVLAAARSSVGGRDRLEVAITDDGVGLAAGEEPVGGLGTRIVMAFLADLGGEISWGRAAGGAGTTVRFSLSPRPVPR